MSKRITLAGGPLKGKTFDVHDTAETFTHHAAPGGKYVVDGDRATWKAASKRADTEGNDKADS